MRQTKIMMDMPITVEITDKNPSPDLFSLVYDYFIYIDNKFSVFKPTSEISQINLGKIKAADYSPDMKTVLSLCQQTKIQSNGYFEIKRRGQLDPSGLVKGWAIYNAAQLLIQKGVKNCYIDAGGDIQIYGHNAENKPWQVGIRNPFNFNEIIKVLQLSNQGIATSGTYIRGQHVYNPQKSGQLITDIVSLTVIGPNVYEADRFATPAFAMGVQGIDFIEQLPGFEGYQIDKNGQATYTSGFSKFVV